MDRTSSADNNQTGASGEQQPNRDIYGALIELQALTRDKMKQLLKTRTLRGFPINMSFTDTDEILTKVSANSIDIY